MTPLDRFAALLQAAPLGLTAEEIADVLWLARRMDAPQPREVPRPESVEGREDKALQRIDRPRDDQATDDRPIAPAPPVVDAALPGPSPSQAAPKGIPFRAPTAAAIPDALGVGRALRPFRRRVAAPSRAVLDEAATARFVADTGVWTGIMRPGASRWLDVDLVVDVASSMSLWSRTTQELGALLSFNGAFRDVRSWRLETEGELRLLAGSRGNDATPHRPRELVDANGRRLVIVVSDCVSTGWHEGRVGEWLARWAASGPLALFQVLPQSHWSRTALAHGAPAALGAASPGIPNTRLTARYLAATPAREREWTLVPVVTLESQSVAAWARMVGGLAGSTVGLALPRGGGVRAEAPVRATTEPSSQERVSRFRATSSPAARKLARLLAAVPVSMPVVRLVRASLVPEARDSDVAEVFLGGLLRVVGEAPRTADLTEYDFHEGVRPLLQDSLDTGEAVRALAIADEVVDRVSKYVESHVGQARDFPAVLGSADGRRAFATLKATVLDRLGGEYAAQAERLRHPAPFPDPSPSSPPPSPVIDEDERRCARIAVSREGGDTVASGYLVDPSLIATCARAVESATEILVTLDGVERDARVVTADLDLDCAILALDGPVSGVAPFPLRPVVASGQPWRGIALGRAGASSFRGTVVGFGERRLLSQVEDEGRRLGTPGAPMIVAGEVIGHVTADRIEDDDPRQRACPSPYVATMLERAWTKRGPPDISPPHPAHVRRAVEDQVERLAAEPGATLLIWGPRGYGKSTLLSVYLAECRRLGAATVVVDAAALASSDLAAPGGIIASLAGTITRQLEALDPDFQAALPPRLRIIFDADTLAQLVESAVEHTGRLVLAFEDIDTLWVGASAAGVQELWQAWARLRGRFDLVLVSARDPTDYLAVDRLEGPQREALHADLVVRAEPFSQAEQVQLYPRLHDLEMTALFELTGGDPRLVRRAAPALERVGFSELLARAPQLDGPFAHELRAVEELFADRPDLDAAFAGLVLRERLPSQLLSELEPYGLVRHDGNQHAPANELYRQFALRRWRSGEGALSTYAARYDAIRADQRHGPERTAAMDELLEAVACQVPSLAVDRARIERLFVSGDPGGRVVALGCCREVPEQAPVHLIVEAIVAALSNFEQWAAVLAAGAVVGAAMPAVSEPCVAALVRELDHPKSRLNNRGEDSNRRAKATVVLETFAGKLGFRGGDPAAFVRSRIHSGVGRPGNGRCVAVLGSNPGGSHAPLCRALGARLAVYGWRVVAGEGDWVGPQVVEGFRSVASSYDAVAYPPSRLGGSKAARLHMIRQADAAMVIAGAEGTQEECVMARAEGIPVLAVASTGGTAQRVAREQSAEGWWRDLPSELRSVLGAPGDAETLAENVVRVLNALPSTTPRVERASSSSSADLLRTVRKERSLRLSWPPGTPLALGDVGIVEAEHFHRMCTLAELGVPFETVNDNTSQQLSFQTSGILAFSDPEVLRLECTRRPALYLQARGSVRHDIRDVDQVGAAVKRLVAAASWDKRWSVVSEVVETERLTIFAGLSVGSAALLRADGSELLARRGSATTCVSIGPATALFRLHGLQGLLRTTWGPVD